VECVRIVEPGLISKARLQKELYGLYRGGLEAAFGTLGYRVRDNSLDIGYDFSIHKNGLSILIDILYSATRNRLRQCLPTRERSPFLR
jgi:hypothetical protein